MVTLERQRERAGREGVDGKAFIAVYGSIGGSPIVFFIIFFFLCDDKEVGWWGKGKNDNKKIYKVCESQLSKAVGEQVLCETSGRVHVPAGSQASKGSEARGSTHEGRGASEKRQAMKRKHDGGG